MSVSFCPKFQFFPQCPMLSQHFSVLGSSSVLSPYPSCSSSLVSVSVCPQSWVIFSLRLSSALGGVLALMVSSGCPPVPAAPIRTEVCGCNYPLVFGKLLFSGRRDNYCSEKTTIAAFPVEVSHTVWTICLLRGAVQQTSGQLVVPGGRKRVFVVSLEQL